MKTILATAKAPAAIGPYSQGIKSGETLYLSGQLGIDPATGKLAEGVGAQTEQSLKNVRSLLAEAGASVEDVVKVTVFITDMEDFPLVNALTATQERSTLPPVPAWPSRRFPSAEPWRSK